MSQAVETAGGVGGVGEVVSLRRRLPADMGVRGEMEKPRGEEKRRGGERGSR